MLVMITLFLIKQ